MHGSPFVNEVEVDIGTSSMSVRIAGCGAPVLFLHGYPLCYRMWDRAIALLADEYMCIAPDFRGFGKNGEVTRSFSIADLADDCHKLLNALQIRQPIVLCGLSMGGYVAMEFVDRRPELVSKVILCNTRCNADDAAGANARRLTAAQALRDGTAHTVAPMLEKLLCKATREMQSDVVELTREMMYETYPSTVAWAQLAMANRRDFTKRMQDWTVPALCIGGEEDPITPPVALKTIANFLPNGQLKIIPNSAHMTPLEQPALFADAFRDFVTAQ